MGQRANLAIVQDGIWRLYYDHWCANRLDVEMFWGPELALAFIEQRPPKEQGALKTAPFPERPQPRERGWLLDEATCAGAAVIDLDERALLLFGGEDMMRNVPLRRAWLALMEENWPHWQIRWAHEGIVAMGDYLGVAREALLMGRDYDPDEAFRVATEFPEDNLTLVTTVRDGRARAWRICGDARALEQGPEGLEALDGVEGAASLVWDDETPIGGAHVDYDSWTVSFWWAGAAPAIEERVAASWPGWKIVWLRDEFEKHLLLAGLDIRLPAWSPAALQAEALGRMRRGCRREGGPLGRALPSHLGGRDLTPGAEERREPVGDEEWKLALIEALEARLPIAPKLNLLHPPGTA